MKKLDVRWLDPQHIPLPPRKRKNLWDLECIKPRKKDILFIEEHLELTYNNKFKQTSHGWLWVYDDVPEHEDSDKHCVLICESGSGVFHYKGFDYPMCAGTYLIFDSTKLHGFTKIGKSVFLVLPVKEKKFP